MYLQQRMWELTNFYHFLSLCDDFEIHSYISVVCLSLSLYRLLRQNYGLLKRHRLRCFQVRCIHTILYRLPLEKKMILV